MMGERTGISAATYQRLERGDPTVSLGAYAMALFALGFEDVLGEIADPRSDEQGTLLETQRLPRRIKPRRPGSGKP
jgi:hypothetical protein